MSTATPAQFRSSDADLIRQVRDHRDPQAFEMLYERHSSLAMSCAMRASLDRTIAADAVQAAFLDIWRNPSGYSSERGPVAAWIAVIARNRSIDIMRRARSQDRVNHAIAAQPAPEEHDLAHDGAVANEEADGLREQLGRLPDEQREVIELSFFDELTHPEIARRLRIPLGTVKGRARLGLERLRYGLTPSRP